MTTSKTSRKHPFLAILGSLVMVALLGLAGYYAGWEYSLSIFFLLPIFFCVHYAGKWPGIIMSLVCGITLFVVDHQSGHPYPHPIIGYWNGLALLGFFLIFTLLMASLEEALQQEQGINRNLETLLTLAPYDERGWDLPFKDSPIKEAGAASPKQPVLEDSSDEETKPEDPKKSG